MDDRLRHGLRGPVRLCTTEQFMWIPKTVCEPGGTCKPTGEVEERRFTIKVEFDRDGRLLPPDCGGATQQSPWTTSYRNGLKVRTFSFPRESLSVPNTMLMYAIEGHDTSYSAPGCTHSETIYDANDRPVELRLLSQRGRVLTRVTLKRDKAGNIVEERQHGSGGIPWPYRLLFLIATRGRSAFHSRSYSYDELGRRVEVSSRLGMLLVSHERIEYNEHGDVAVRRAEQIGRSLSMYWLIRSKPTPDIRHESETRFEYVYDSHGNWVEETVRPAASKEPCSRRLRTIGYWD